MTLWKRICRLKKGYDAKKSRIRRRFDRKRLMSKELGIGCGDESLLGKQKSRLWKTESGSDIVRKKCKMTGNNRVYDRNGEIDRISELPESIIHHIFSFLHCSKDVARTAVLSKNWKGMFNSYHSFDFDERWFRIERGKGKHNRIKAREVQKKSFERYVERSIATRLVPLVSIEKFRLYADNVDLPMVASVANWIRAAIDKNVKELDIRLYREGIFVLPDNVVASGSIVSLKLSGSILYNFAAIKLCNLRELSIKDSMVMDAYVVEKFEENCPLLEDLRFVGCPTLAQLVISSLVKLRRVEIQDCAGLFHVKIGGSNHLESFWYHAKKNQQCKIDLRDTGNLKNLTLKDSMMTDSAFEDWIFKCPLLEKLVLLECTELDKIKIFSGKLKSLALILCRKLSEANIDAPSMYSLEYSGHMMPFHSMNAPRLRQVKLSFGPIAKEKPQAQWISGYQNFFGNLDGFNGFKLIVYSKLSMKIFDEPSETPLVEDNFQRLELTPSSVSVLKTVDNWLRECQGKSLTLASSDSEIIKVISTMITEREDNPSCCRFYSNKCWRHYIADVKISTLQNGEETCYDFTWRSRRSDSPKGRNALHHK